MLLGLQGIVRALEEYQHKLLEHSVTIFVRRGGPNYQEGLRVMREVGMNTVFVVILHVHACGHCPVHEIITFPVISSNRN